MLYLIEIIFALAALVLTWFWWTSSEHSNSNSKKRRRSGTSSSLKTLNSSGSSPLTDGSHRRTSSSVVAPPPVLDELFSDDDDENDADFDTFERARQFEDDEFTQSSADNESSREAWFRTGIAPPTAPAAATTNHSQLSLEQANLSGGASSTTSDDDDGDEGEDEESSNRLNSDEASDDDNDDDEDLMHDSFRFPLPNEPRFVNGERKYRIAFCSDFCYPNMGGVEMHIYQLSQCLIQLGHKVIIITHSYGNRKGVRYMSSGLKTYYISQKPFYNGNSLPTCGVFLFPIVRNVLLRERIEILHSHQAFSTMGHEALVFARTMGLKTCFTDHSLFGFADASSILMNKVLKFSLSDIDHVICVSNTSKENTCLRASLEPELVSVIPNAIDTTTFTPDLTAKDPDKITIVVISRLVYRKGIDLLVEVVPKMCAMYPRVHWIIGGDGPKRLALEEMREKQQLHDRVEMLGAVAHDKVRDVLVRGDVFLNSSLTEAFCIAIVEAVSAGLSCVSTKVGGVPEVFPSDMIRLARPECDDICEKLVQAIETLADHRPLEQHQRVRQMYSWLTVARRTQKVYDRIIANPNVPLWERFNRVYGCGLYAGKFNVFTIALVYLWYRVLETICPREHIDIAPDFIHAS